MKPTAPVQSLMLLTQFAESHPEEFERATHHICAERPNLIKGIKTLSRVARRAADRAESEAVQNWDKFQAESIGLGKVAQIRLRIRQSRMEASQGIMRQLLRKVSQAFSNRGEGMPGIGLTRARTIQAPNREGDRGQER